MKLFGSRNRQSALAAVPAGGGNGAAPVRFADPIAQAMSAGHRRSADIMWFGGVTFRMDGESR